MHEIHYDIRTYGAIGDGQVINTTAIQQAIDDCSAAGGGIVRIAGGRYVTGTLYLKDGVTLHVSVDGALLGSTAIADYATDTHKNMYKNEPHMDRCLIFARDAANIGIEGRGVIDGQGQPEHFPNADDPQGNRPMLIRFVGCTNIRLRDITLQHPAAWTSAWLYCSHIIVDGIRISSRVNGNGDGLDFDGCENVSVSNSSFDTSDDSICLQTSRPDMPCRDIRISNCLFVSKWAGIRIGLLSRGDFDGVTVTNCVFSDIQDSGLKIQMCEGAVMQNMAFSNLIMRNVPRPVFMTFCQQRACVDAPEELAPMRAMRRMTFSNIVVDSSACDHDSAIIISGMPGHPIEDLLFSDIILHTGGGGTAEAAMRHVPEYTPETLGGWWPEYYGLGGAVPAHGIYARHIRGLTLRNIRITPAHADARPAIACNRVTELALDGIALPGGVAGDTAIRLQDVQRARTLP